MDENAIEHSRSIGGGKEAAVDYIEFKIDIITSLQLRFGRMCTFFPGRATKLLF
jgi:hypothetical protein